MSPRPASLLPPLSGAALGFTLACQPDDPGTCDAAPAPTFEYGDRTCGGVGFSLARISLDDLELMVDVGDPEGAPFSYRMTGWRPASHGVVLEFALDGRSFSSRLVVQGPPAAFQGVRATLTRDVGQGIEPVDEATADAAGALELALPDNGLGIQYELSLAGWPANSCDELSLDLPC